ncbi:hypothetical protein AALO_G00120730 [Alosa alosa]|uniref:Lysosome-associated membrane glycoprotein 2-like luminal domain-containing protein n=1 Tax=Alosa alosa TaxID=278164 RepID=A0AAV6GNT7_9TELE|nr:lysosome-associated membrane glycoprotein 3 [Alosa sapidissima]XP_048109008.1 lysosome-associated membrane glycoprotein 3 [Alosa alosa]KAG5275476.1 hypothetical protein AALO_G00120730 [Alosa alosa]
MRINRSRGLNTFTKWLLLSSVVLLKGSTVTELDKPLSKPSSHGSPNVTMSKKSSLQPTPSPPLLGSYRLTNPDGNVCLKAVLGVEYMVTVNKKFYYFNMNPLATHATGYCGNQTAVLSLEFDEGNLEFTFHKGSKEYYTRRLQALLGPISVCDKCRNQSYPGTVDRQTLFKTTTGLSFKCKSELVVKMSPNFRLKILSVQFQPFDLAMGQFGKDFECWQDYIKRIIPIILGAIAVGILLIATISYLVVREYRHRGYESL